jgi:hypothetical protein
MGAFHPFPRTRVLLSKFRIVGSRPLPIDGYQKLQLFLALARAYWSGNSGTPASLSPRVMDPENSGRTQI